ncbi:hypothetical protein [Caulobacter segnis]
MPLAILKTLALAAALATPMAADPAACALGARLIAQQTAHGNKVVFDAEDEIPTYPFVDVGAKLPETLRVAVTRQPPRNLFKACPSWRTGCLPTPASPPPKSGPRCGASARSLAPI